MSLLSTPTVPTEEFNKKKLVKETEKMAAQIGALQHKLYAEGKKSLLVILQGVDASGKDGTVKNVFKSCNPTGIDVYGFKKPTEEEFAHDFLWRVHKVVPQKGNIMIFNRSHYEDILIQRVHNWITEERVHYRMKAINAFEQLLEFDNNTKVLKFYLHISKEEQETRLQERIDDPEKRWKHNEGDWEERKHWDAYMKCYEYVFTESEIPWHIIPADKGSYRNYLIAKKVLQTLTEMNPVLQS
ncbi:MAG: polyphosphate kinase [Saprospiraceae bacterium]|nr:polyphosphate kinase [Saprospiraceae bacterium]